MKERSFEVRPGNTIKERKEIGLRVIEYVVPHPYPSNKQRVVVTWLIVTVQVLYKLYLTDQLM